jgi:restriction system protein
MGIPDYQSIMLPLLRATGDGQEHTVTSLVEALAMTFKVTADERRQLLPSGRQFLFDNRVGWARTYLKKSGLLSSPKRGHIQITQRGAQVLSQKLD